MEASALNRASKRGLLARRTPLLRMESDTRLVALIRAGHDSAFETLFNRYHSRLLGFCQSMLKSRQDAEDVLQEVFANAHSAMLNDEREINVRPWLYRIARNRCLNHLRKPVPDGQDSMDILPYEHGTSTAERVQNREELRQLLSDVETLPETQRTALLLREVDQMSYEEIAQAMQTTVPSVKSLLVRARIGLAESSQARMLTCGEVQVKLAEAAEGLAKTTGPIRKHVRSCEECRTFRDQLRADHKALASIVPVGLFGLLNGGLLAKIFGGGAAGGAGSAAAGGAAGGAAVGGAAGAAAGGASAIGGIAGAIGSAVGTKAAAGVATAALLTAGAVEVQSGGTPAEPVNMARATLSAPAHGNPHPTSQQGSGKTGAMTLTETTPAAASPAAREQRSAGDVEDAAPPIEPPASETGSEGTEPSSPADPVENPPIDEGEVAIGAPPADGSDGSGGTPATDPAEIPVTDPSGPVDVPEVPVLTPPPPVQSSPVGPPATTPSPVQPEAPAAPTPSPAQPTR